MRDEKAFAVYLMTNRPRGVFYVGVSSALRTRVIQHKDGVFEGFTSRYNLHNLVWMEWHLDPYAAIKREKQIKRWRREWKIELVEKVNPEWRDLTHTLHL